MLAQATDPNRPPPSSTSAPPGFQVVGASGTRADSARRRPWHEQPRFVMARSLLIPGWGQAHNGAWLKAGLVAGAESWLVVLVVKDQRELDRLLGEIEANPDSDAAREDELVNQYNAVVDQQIARQWMLGFVLVYALVDAYVDAHFRGIEVEFENDPALPARPSPESSVRRAMPSGMRLALRWTF